MDKLLFRCHNAGNLLTEPKLKSDKEAGKLSETAKSLVESMWLKNNFGYEERVFTDDMMKGLLCEQDSMQLVQDVLKGEFRVRYNQLVQNEYIVGTPDIVLEKEDCVEDIKTSSNLRTFFEAEPTKLYITQAQCYMALTGKKNYRLIYCLVPTPHELIVNEQKKIWYKFNCDEENEDYIRAAMQVEKNNDLIKMIPKEKRIKVFNFSFDEELINTLYQKIEKAREYYNTLELKSAI